MNVGTPESGAEKEQLFSEWITKKDLGEFSAMKFWVDHEAMPNGAGAVYREWRDRIGNMKEDDPETLELAKQFEELTGYTAEEFMAYVDKLNAS